MFFPLVSQWTVYFKMKKGKIKEKGHIGLGACIESFRWALDDGKW